MDPDTWALTLALGAPLVTVVLFETVSCREWAEQGLQARQVQSTGHCGVAHSAPQLAAPQHRGTGMLAAQRQRAM
jgi:hypothetical protein